MNPGEARELVWGSPDERLGYVQRGSWSTISLAEHVKALARDRPTDVAWIHKGGASLTWEEYYDLSRRVARSLEERAVGPGGRIAVVAPEGPEAHVLYLGAELAGVTVVGLPRRLGPVELATLLERGDVDILARVAQDAGSRSDDDSHRVPTVGYEDLVSGTGHPSEGRLGLGPDDLFFMGATSGTTGVPKLVAQTQNRWFFFTRVAADAGALTEADRFLGLLPVHTAFALWSAHFAPTVLGAESVWLRHFDPAEALETMREHEVTVLAAVTTQFLLLLRELESGAPRPSALRVLFTGGEAVPRDQAARFEQLTGAHVLQFYGSTETAAVSRTTIRDPQDKRLGTAGRPVAESNLRFFNEDGQPLESDRGPGRPGVRGPANSLGYVGDQEANSRLITSEGWILTEDLAEIDEDGYLVIRGRTGDFVNRGGHKISIGELETVLSTHPDIAMVAVVPVPDAVFGERACAVLVTRSGGQLTIEDLQDHVRSQGHHVSMAPERVEHMTSLPTSSGGKVAKEQLLTLLTNSQAGGQVADS